MRKILMILLLGLFLVSLVSATIVTDAHNIAMGNTGSITAKSGMRFIANYNSILVNVTKSSSSTATTAYLLDSSKAVLSSSTYVSNVANFSYPLTAGTTYYVASDSGGAAYNQAYSNIVNPYNITNTSVNWTGGLDQGVDNSGRTLNIESITTATVDVTINSPDNAARYLIGANITFNWTSSSASLVNTSLWIDGVRNTTINISGSTNTTLYYLSNLAMGSHTFYVNSCSLASCTNSSSRNITISNWALDTFYAPTTTTPGSTNLFGVNLNHTGGVYVSSAILIYNGTNYTLSVSNAAAGANLTRNLVIPATTGNLSYMFNFTFNDTTTGSLGPYYVTISNISMDSCSSYTHRLYNFTVYNEETLAKLTGSTDSVNASINIQIYDSSRSTIYSNYSTNSVNTNPFAVCLANQLNANTNYSIDVQVQYWANGYSKEFYNIKNDLISNADLNTNVSLYPLLNTSSQEFTITYRDASYLPVANAVIQIQRKYVGEGIFRTVEQPITDTLGSTLAHLQLDTAIYTFVILVDNEVQSTFSNKLAVCAVPSLSECVINLNELTSNVDYTDYANVNGVAFTVSYDTDSRAISSIFSQNAGSPVNMWLKVSLLDNFGNTTVCNTTLYSSSGTLSCTVPSAFGNNSVVVDLYADGVHVGQSVISTNQDPRTIYGASRVAIGIIMVVSWVAVGLIGVPIISGIFLILALVSLISLNIIGSTGLIGAGATALWFIVAVALVIFRGGNR